MTRPEDGPEDWTDLAKVWTTPGATADPAPEPAGDLERRVRRRARLATLNFHLEAWGAVVAGGLGAWVAVRHDAPLLGFAGVAFSLFALAATVWARRDARPGDAETPAAALAGARRQARSGLRWARAGQAICVAALLFLGVVGLTHPNAHLPAIYLAAFVFLGGMAVFYERHARISRTRIARHEAALRELEEG
jgi:hypothetical protein